MNLKLSFIADNIKGSLVGEDMTITDLVTDSRAVTPGCIFAVIKGERADGMNFVKGLDKTPGVAYLTDRVPDDVKNPYILADDVITAIGGIARLHLNTCKAKHIAVTGSVGKTTTKDYIAAALQKCISVHFSKGNRNNELGMPLTVLGTPENADALVVEMGMRGFDQITYLCNIAKPDIAVITNIGISHIELLGSRENILKAKLEIADALPENGTLILNADDDMLSNVKTDKNTVFFGIQNAKADIRAINVVDNTFTLVCDNTCYPVELSTLGIHNVYNALAAIAVGRAMGCDIKKLIRGVSEYAGDGRRQNIYEYKDLRIFDDTYNASPASVNAAMQVMKNFEGRRVLVLGDMLELGKSSESAHRSLADGVKDIEASLVICIGCEMKYLYDALPDIEKYHCMTNAEALGILKNTVKSGDNILFKGSNGMNLQGLLKDFKEEYQK